jgi:adenylate kinase family enzyme
LSPLSLNLIEYLKRKSPSVINVIGSPGSGKTTLSKNIQYYFPEYSILNIDELFEYKSKKSKVYSDLMKEISSQDKIIIDGTYTSLLSLERINNTDLFILIDYHSLKCISRVFSRHVKGKYKFHNEKLSLRLVSEILHFPQKRIKIINQIREEKLIYIE